MDRAYGAEFPGGGCIAEDARLPRCHSVVPGYLDRSLALICVISPADHRPAHPLAVAAYRGLRTVSDETVDGACLADVVS